MCWNQHSQVPREPTRPNQEASPHLLTFQKMLLAPGVCALLRPKERHVDPRKQVERGSEAYPTHG